MVKRVLILELKTAEAITKTHEAQLKNYIRATEIEVGLVLGFGERARFSRVVLTNDRKRFSSLIRSDPSFILRIRAGFTQCEGERR